MSTESMNENASAASAECPSCATVGANTWGMRDGHAILECASCEMLYYRRPIESPFEYQEYYPYLSGFDADRFKWELGIRRGKFNAQLSAIERLLPDVRILVDVGAGPGYFSRVAAERGYTALAVEPSDAARRAGTEQFGVEYTKLEELADASVDVIVCHHVLEHIEWPQSFLKTLRDKLRAGGLLVLHVPNQQPLSFLIRDRVRPDETATKCAMYYPVHINGFTARSLVRTVERQNFRAVTTFDVSMWSAYYDPFFLANFYRDGRSAVSATRSVLTHAARCAIDVIGNPIGRGDWVIGYFRAIE
jgi:SAM-dependent methyltransferase